MACMTHECGACQHTWFDNECSHRQCPKCGSEEVMSFFDEDDVYEEDDDRWLDEEDES